jgi:DNA mismatch repair ATPase MutS
MKKALSYFVHGLVLLSLMVPSSAMCYDEPFLQSIRNEMVNSFELTPQKPVKPKIIKAKSFVDKIKALWTRQEIETPSITDRQKLEISFDQMGLPFFLKEKPVIDFEVINKLEVLQGGAHGSENLVKQLTTISDGEKSKTLLYTTPGLKVMSELISMPTANLVVVNSRQEVIKELVSNTALREKCMSLLQEMKKHEPYFYQMYAKDDLSEEELSIYPGRILSAFKLHEIPTAISVANVIYAGYSWLLEIALVGIFLSFPSIVKSMVRRKRIQIMKKEKYSDTAKKEWQEGDILPELTQDELSKIERGVELHVANFNDELRKVQALLGVIAGATLPAVVAHTGAVKAEFDIILNFQERLIHVAAYLKNARELLRILSKNMVIDKTMPQLQKDVNVILDKNYGSDRFKKLQELLNTSTFEGPGPSRFSLPGNILVAYKLFSEKDTRSYYQKLLQLVGEMDVYVALAQKMKAHENMDAKFCFVQFDQEGGKPYIKAEGIWNPFLPAQIAITNSLHLNTGNEQSMLLTGPNTSGKSTLLKAVILNLIMAQTFGIAPASSLTMTPFTKILSYLSITDDVKAGVSQFKAEVLRAEVVAKIVSELSAKEFAFIGIDEMFTGTAPQQAETLSYNFIKHLSTFKNVLFINATHFGKLTALEQETGGKVKNYHMGAQVNEKGKVIRYTRKLVPGKAQISSAEQVATEGGILEKWIE